MYNWPVSADQAAVKLVQLQKVVGVPNSGPCGPGRRLKSMEMTQEPIEIIEIRGSCQMYTASF